MCEEPFAVCVKASPPDERRPHPDPDPDSDAYPDPDLKVSAAEMREHSLYKEAREAYDNSVAVALAGCNQADIARSHLSRGNLEVRRRTIGLGFGVSGLWMVDD